MAFNPRIQPKYFGNARRIVDVVTLAGQKRLTSMSGGFAGAEVGQTIWVSNRMPQTTIGAVISTDEVDTVASAASSAAACECVFGGDDTVAFKSAFAAATDGGRKATMEVPNADCILTERFFSYSGSYGPNLVGEDDGTCVVFMSPAIPIPGDGSGILIRAIGGNNRFANFVIWCPKQLYNMANNQAMLHVDGGSLQFQNIQVVNPYSSGASGAIRTFNGNLAAQSTYVYTFDDSPGSSPVGSTCRGWLQSRMSGTMVKPFFSNLHSSLDITDLVARRGVGAGPSMQIVGGHFDENGGPTANVVLRGNASLQILGALVWTSSAPGNYAISVDSTSKLWLEQCGLGPYAANTSGARALKIDEGGIARAAGSTFWCTDSAGDVSVQNDGTFEDYGGNDFMQAYPTVGPVPAVKAIANLDIRWQTPLQTGLCKMPRRVTKITDKNDPGFGFFAVEGVEGFYQEDVATRVAKQMDAGCTTSKGGM